MHCLDRISTTILPTSYMCLMKMATPKPPFLRALRISFNDMKTAQFGLTVATGTSLREGNGDVRIPERGCVPGNSIGAIRTSWYGSGTLYAELSAIGPRRPTSAVAQTGQETH